MGRASSQKITKETLDLNHTLDQMNPIDTYKTFNPTTEYTFFSSTHRTFLRIDHMTGHRTGLNQI